MTDTHDVLDLADGARLAIVADGRELAAVPEVRDGPRGWRRARPGDGAADALIAVLARGSAQRGNFTVRSWTTRITKGERPIGVDQTNESVIVGEVAVVKWATHLQDGPHPAPRRIGLLRDAGFGGMPAPWGLVTWRAPDGNETMVAYADDYLPGAVDGWTWAVGLITDAAANGDRDSLVAATEAVGTVVAELHSALAETARVASEADAARWRADALEVLDITCAMDGFASVRYARSHRDDIEMVLDRLGTLAGTPVVEGHGDLHVGQVLRGPAGFVVTDFDGNPVLPATQRMLPIPTALDVAGMTQSLAHTAIVAAKYTALDPRALADVDAAGRASFLGAYERRLAALGNGELFRPELVPAFRVQQVLREIIYAARHLPRWMYVPDAALPAVLKEGISS